MDTLMFDAHARMEAEHWWFVGRRRALLPLFESAMAGHETDLVVDVGCGTGGTVGTLGRSYRMIGIDQSAEAITAARRNYPEQSFILGAVASELAELAGEAALYLIMDVLEHVEDDRGFLATVVDQARTGSHVLVTVPAGRHLWSRHDETASHLRRYEWDSLSALIQGLPVETRLLSYFNSRLYPPISLARWIGRRLAVSLGQNNTDFAMPPAPVNGLLARLFGGEATALAAALDQGRPAYRQGVSLVALLRRR